MGGGQLPADPLVPPVPPVADPPVPPVAAPPVPPVAAVPPVPALPPVSPPPPVPLTPPLPATPPPPLTPPPLPPASPAAPPPAGGVLAKVLSLAASQADSASHVEAMPASKVFLCTPCLGCQLRATVPYVRVRGRDRALFSMQSKNQRRSRPSRARIAPDSPGTRQVSLAFHRWAPPVDSQTDLRLPYPEMVEGWTYAAKTIRIRIVKRIFDFPVCGLRAHGNFGESPPQGGLRVATT